MKASDLPGLGVEPNYDVLGKPVSEISQLMINDSIPKQNQTKYYINLLAQLFYYQKDHYP